MNWLRKVLHPVIPALIAASAYIADHAPAIASLTPPKLLPIVTGVFGFLAAFGLHIRSSNGQ